MSNFYEYFSGQEGGGKCSLCESPGTTKTTCPLNPGAKNPNFTKHPLASKIAKKPVAKKAPAAAKPAKAKPVAKPKGKIVIKPKQNQGLLTATFLKASSGTNTKVKPAFDLEKLDSWIDLKNKIPSYGRSPYAQEQFHLITLSQYMHLMEKLAEKVFFPNQDQVKNWVGEKPKFGVEYDPIFVQKVKVPENSKITVIGDLHSSLTSFVNILEALRDKEGYFRNNLTLKKDHYIFFSGDIVDRGPYGIELLSMISQLQINNPDQVFLANGNHEDYEIYARYGFADEIEGQFDIQRAEVITLTHFLHYLPSAIYLEVGDKRYQICHGAMTKDENEQKAISQLLKNKDETKQFSFLGNYQIGGRDVIDNLKWGDFTLNPGIYKSPRDGYRGGVNEFGRDVVSKYLNDLEVTAIISGHQDVSNLTFVTRQRDNNLKMELDPRYNLLRPKDYDQIELGKPLSYKPGEDFIALNTSSAYMSKKNKALQYDVYLNLI